MVKLLDRVVLDYGAESRQKVDFKAGLCYLMTGKPCQPSREWVPFSTLGRIRHLIFFFTDKFMSLSEDLTTYKMVTLSS